MTTKGLTRVAPGVYRNTAGQLVHIISSRDRARAKKNDGKRATQMRGREVSVRDSSSDGQVIYGQMRVGGVFTFLDTNKDSKAYLRTGSNNSQIVWIAKASGSVGNGISVTIQCTGTNGSIIVTVADNDITVRVKSSGGTSQSTAAQVITAIKADTSANALVNVHAGDGTGASNVQAESVQNLSGGGGTLLHQYHTIACHEIESIDELYLDDQEVQFGATSDPRWATGDHAGRVFLAKQLGADSQTVQLDLQGQVGSTVWSDNHTQKGCAGAYVITVWSASLFPNGIPEVAFLVKGKKCYDFRTGLTLWTQNAALIIADFLMDTKFGLGVSLSDMDVDSWSDAADICEDTITLTGGGTEFRYTINGVFDTSMSPQTVLEDMAQAIAGDIVFQSGKWRCIPGAWRTPSSTFSETDFRGEVKITTTIPRRDRFNSVKGSFISPEKYQEADYPALINSGYVSADGETIWANINQPFVTSSGQCQRVANIELKRVRQGIEVFAAFSPTLLNKQIGDVISLSYEKFGWVEKYFEIRDVIFEDGLQVGPSVTLRLRETAEAIYIDAANTEVDIAPNTTLPSPLDIDVPTALTLTSGTDELYLRNDGTVFSRIKAAWTAPNDIFVTDGGHYEIQYKRNSEDTWQNASNVPGDQSFTYILDVQDGVRYDVQIRAVNSIGTKSDWLTETGHNVVGKTAAPEDVTGFTSSTSAFGIELSWNAVSDVDVREYEVRLGTSWGAETTAVVGTVRGTRYRVDIKTAGSYTFHVKAVDTSGNYSANAASTVTTVISPDAPIISYVIDGADLVLSWAEVTSIFAVASYELRYGDIYGSATPLGEVKGTVFRMPVTWGGDRTFWVAARDVAGNLGTAQSIVVTIVYPGDANNLTVQPLDNNALIRWTFATPGSLPIAKYTLYKGPSLDDAETLGDISGTFASQFELQGGTYTYWVVAVDTAGNEAPGVSVSILLDSPPDFIFLFDYTFDTVSDATLAHHVYVSDYGFEETTTAGEPIGLLLGLTYA